jgi:CheY-like chemotaxis protein
MPKILIVDDEWMNRDMLSRRLVRRGYVVICAASGSEALATAKAEMPDVILMDLKMPVLDGYETTRQLKESSVTSSIPVIGLSAYAMKGDAERAIAAGCDDYDTKPIELPRLLGKVDGFLQKQRGE